MTIADTITTITLKMPEWEEVINIIKQAKCINFKLVKFFKNSYITKYFCCFRGSTKSKSYRTRR